MFVECTCGGEALPYLLSAPIQGVSVSSLLVVAKQLTGTA